MSLTGLFLILFLIIHLAGNLQLLFDDNGMAFNMYAEKMAHNPLIQTVSIGNFFFIILHAVNGLVLAVQNRRARGTRYAVSTKDSKSSWASKNMALLGTLLLIFIVAHLKGFWFESKFGSVPFVSYEGQEYKDLYTIVSEAYAQPLYAIFYVVCMVVLAFHLSHGFASAFQSLGLNHKKYSPAIAKIGLVYSILVPLGFALIPICMYLGITI